jgi:mannose-6-phosphate isomerase-like protein (cupin superfamily)
MTIDILAKAKANELFRRVVFTGAKSQLVVMCIEPQGEIGEEVHDHVEQLIFNVSGSAKTIINGVATDFVAGEVLVIAPGTKHNIINSGSDKLKLYTVYTPANHIDQRIHATKQDADTDVADEQFGQSV